MLEFSIVVAILVVAYVVLGIYFIYHRTVKISEKIDKIHYISNEIYKIVDEELIYLTSDKKKLEQENRDMYY